MKSLVKLLLNLALLTYWCSIVTAEETCTWKEDGSKICSDEEVESHDVWRDQEHEDDQLDKDPLIKEGFNEIELEFFVNFFSQLGNWNPKKDSLAKFKPEFLVLAVVNTFNGFDSDDDGYLTYDEIETKVKKQEKREDLGKIEQLMEKYDDGKISIFEYLQIFFKLANGKTMKPLLEPFLRLKNLPVSGAKKIIQGSVQMFIDSDVDHNGLLDKEEFSNGMEKTRERMPEGRNAQINDEHVLGLFNMMDKDDDKLLSYSEFQATIPEPPKPLDESLNEIFDSADANSNGFLSESEFSEHMQARAKEMKLKVPSDEEMAEVFHKLDLDADDNLTPTEMFELFKEAKANKQKQMVEAFGAFDQDKDGSISLDELTKIVEGMEQATGKKVDAKLFMTMLDEDGDGKVSMKEMEGMIASSMKMQ